MNLQPLYDRILVKRDETASISTVIWTPKQAPEKVQTGTVVACGPGFRDDKGAYHQMTVKVGDKVAFMRQAGVAMGGDSADKEDLLVFREFDLLGIVTQPEGEAS